MKAFTKLPTIVVPLLLLDTETVHSFSTFSVAAQRLTLEKSSVLHYKEGKDGETNIEIKGYGSSLVETDPNLYDSLGKLTAKRPYPMLLTEKFAKYVIDDVFQPDKFSSSKSLKKTAKPDEKEKLVVLGAGWGSAALLQGIDNDRYDVTVISPRNFFLYTPMLAGASVGTVEVRSICQPIREFNREAHYLEAGATAIDVETQAVACEAIRCKDDIDEPCELVEDIMVPYDRLVVAVGARINTFGIPGVEEHCAFLKQIDDARRIRRKIVNLFERASMPDLSDNERKALLTFAIIGAGPTGVEFAGELRDFIEQDCPKYYPNLLKDIRIKLIEAGPTVLNPFDKVLQDAAVASLSSHTASPSVKDSAIPSLFPDEMIEIILNKKVREVSEDKIHFGSNDKDISYGLAVWAGGIGPLDITLDIIQALGSQQKTANAAGGKIAVDPWMRAMGGNGKIFAIGDCASVEDSRLPSTAQVAAQEGEFLAHILSTGNLTDETCNDVLLPPRRDPAKIKSMDIVTKCATSNDDFLAPFNFLDMGMLAYTGQQTALAQVQLVPDNDKARMKAAGKVGFGLWRGIYLMKQPSLRNRVLIAIDWAKSKMFGRDITSFE